MPAVASRDARRQQSGPSGVVERGWRRASTENSSEATDFLRRRLFLTGVVPSAATAAVGMVDREVLVSQVGGIGLANGMLALVPPYAMVQVQ